MTKRIIEDTSPTYETIINQSYAAPEEDIGVLAAVLAAAHPQSRHTKLSNEVTSCRWCAGEKSPQANRLLEVAKKIPRPTHEMTQQPEGLLPPPLLLFGRKSSSC